MEEYLAMMEKQTPEGFGETPNLEVEDEQPKEDDQIQEKKLQANFGD